MLEKNLLKTWNLLAPEEIWPWNDDDEFLYTSPIAFYKADGDCEVKRWELQGYLQQCIEAREWGLKLSIPDKTRIGEFDAEIQIGTSYFYAQSPTNLCEALLTAYITAIASQRSITSGKWRHFKGGKYQVVNVAHWKPFESNSDFDALMTPYIFESTLSMGICLDLHFWLCGSMKEPPNYYTSSDNLNYGAIVFYKGIPKKWARKPEDFLGLVGSEHPEQAGLLRFVEVSDGSAS